MECNFVLSFSAKLDLIIDYLIDFLGGNSDYAMDLHQKEQLHDNSVPMMQQHFSVSIVSSYIALSVIVVNLISLYLLL